MELKYKNDLEDVEQPLDQQIKGSQICEHCKGTGWLKRGKKSKETCIYCDGKGTIYLVDCPDCFGTGVSSNRGVCGTCKGKKTVSTVDAENIQKSRELCAQFKENPIVVLAPAVACIVAMAFTAKPVWDRVVIDPNLLYHWFDAIPGAIMAFCFIYLLRLCIHLFMGSVYDPDRGSIRTVAVVTLCAGILAAVILGPVKSDGFSWIEKEARSEINKGVLRNQVTQCLNVDIEKQSGNTFYGKANLSNKESKDVVVHFSAKTIRHHKYSYRVYDVRVSFSQP